MNAAPLALGSSLAITRGQSLQFSARDLAPKVTVPYEVNAIRMLAYAAAPLNATGEPGIAPDSSLRGFLRFQFTLGPIPLTDHFIPMWNLCPIRQAITEFGGYFSGGSLGPRDLPRWPDRRVSSTRSTPNVAGADDHDQDRLGRSAPTSRRCPTWWTCRSSRAGTPP
jgi:hypothetical protein